MNTRLTNSQGVARKDERVFRFESDSASHQGTLYRVLHDGVMAERDVYFEVSAVIIAFVLLGSGKETS